VSYRDLEELLAERGVEVDHVTVYRWVQRFTPLFADAARPARHATGDRWFVDETYVKVAGRWRYLYRAVDQHRRTCTSTAPPAGSATPLPSRSSASGSCCRGPAQLPHLQRGGDRLRRGPPRK
jgi:transposase InsO family protein